MYLKFDEIVRVGKVSSIDEKKCTARVLFEDRQDFVTYDLFILTPLTLKDMSYYMPQIEERVVCIFLPVGNHVGYILGSYYCDKREVPFKDKDKTYIKFEDNTLIMYDKKEHTLTIDVQSSNATSIDIKASKDILVKCDANVTVEATKDVYIKSKILTVECTNEINLISGKAINLSAPIVTGDNI